VLPRRKFLAAIAIGVVLAGPPVVALNLWLNGLVERQGREELELAAKRHLALTEARLTRTLRTLDDLASRGINSCGDDQIEALRQATFGTIPVKELSIIAPDGRTLCTDIGNQTDHRVVISSEPLSSDSRNVLELVRLGEHREQWVRIRRVTGAGNGVAALIPAMLFVPQVSTSGGPMRFQAQMLSAGGAQIAVVGETTSAADRANDLVADLSSNQYGLHAIVSAPPVALSASQGDLRILGFMASGALAIVILALSVLLPRRERENPIDEIAQALQAGEFVPYYQPIVDIRSGRLRGAEVLARWRKPDGSIVPPALFIPLAESSGLIIELTRSLMRRACQEMGGALGPRPHLKIGFNLTARHFANEEIVEDVRKIFKKSRLKLQQIVLEVTERQPIENLTDTRRVVAALQGLGVKVAIDDVGTGHSGLSYMLKLGVDIIKIDKLFIDALGTDRYSNTIIETLIDLALNMRMEVIAEGVESFEQVLHLRDLGIRQAQGFVFSPPLPGSAFLQLVETIDPIKAAAPAADQPGAAIPALASPSAA
jgi:sensor c-di-GMP phosphodiesterase-like protein